MNKIKAFTLLEVLITVIIIGILAGLAIPNFTKSRERALDKEAQTVLSLIQSAEKMYYMKDETSYYPSIANTSVNVNSINSYLRLNLFSASWDYGINTDADTAYTATAGRLNGPSGWNRTWEIIASDTVARCISGPCP